MFELKLISFLFLSGVGETARGDRAREGERTEREICSIERGRKKVEEEKQVSERERERERERGD